MRCWSRTRSWMIWCRSTSIRYLRMSRCWGNMRRWYRICRGRWVTVMCNCRKKIRKLSSWWWNCSKKKYRLRKLLEWIRRFRRFWSQTECNFNIRFRSCRNRYILCMKRLVFIRRGWRRRELIWMFNRLVLLRRRFRKKGTKKYKNLRIWNDHINRRWRINLFRLLNWLLS